MTDNEMTNMESVNEKVLLAFCKDLTKVLEGNIKQQKDLIASLRKMLEKEEKKCADLEAKLETCRNKLKQPPKPKKVKVELPFNAVKKLKNEGTASLLTALNEVSEDVLDAFLKRMDSHHQYQVKGMSTESKRKAICVLATRMLEHGNVFRRD